MNTNYINSPLIILLLLLGSLFSNRIYGQDCCLANAGSIASIEISNGSVDSLFNIHVVGVNHLIDSAYTFVYIVTALPDLNIQDVSMDGVFTDFSPNAWPNDGNFNIFQLSFLTEELPNPSLDIPITLGLLGTVIECLDWVLSEELSFTEDIGLHEYEVPEPAVIPDILQYVFFEFPEISFLGYCYDYSEEAFILGNGVSLIYSDNGFLNAIEGLTIDNLPTSILETIELEGFTTVLDVVYEENGNFAVQVQNNNTGQITFLEFAAYGTFIEITLESNDFVGGDCCVSNAGTIASIEISPSMGDSLYTIQVVSENFQTGNAYVFAYFLVNPLPNLIVKDLSFDGYFETNQTEFQIFTLSILESELPLPLELEYVIGLDVGVGDIFACFDSELSPYYSLPDNLGFFEYEVIEPEPIPDIGDYLAENFPEANILCFANSTFQLDNGIFLTVDENGNVIGIEGVSIETIPSIILDWLTQEGFTTILSVTESNNTIFIEANDEDGLTYYFYFSSSGNLETVISTCLANAGNIEVELIQNPDQYSNQVLVTVSEFQEDDLYSLAYVLVDTINFEIQKASSNNQIFTNDDPFAVATISYLTAGNTDSFSNWEGNNLFDFLETLPCSDYTLSDFVVPAQLPESFQSYLEENYLDIPIIDWTIENGSIISVLLENDIYFYLDENGIITDLEGLTIDNLPASIEMYLVENGYFDEVELIEVDYDANGNPIIIITINIGGKDSDQLILTFDVNGNLLEEQTIVEEPVLSDVTTEYLTENYPNDSIVEYLEEEGDLLGLVLDNGVTIYLNQEGAVTNLEGINADNLPNTIESYLNETEFPEELNYIVEVFIPSSNDLIIITLAYVSGNGQILAFDFNGNLIESDFISGIENINDSSIISFSQETQSLSVPNSIGQLDQIMIYNTTGQVLYIEDKTPTIIDLSNKGLGAGMFFVQIRLEGQVFVRKFVLH